jgi:uncharacterized membrane-anchored protein YjiN (DUF445 family)
MDEAAAGENDSFRAMRRAATGLLLLMTAVFVVSHVWGSEHGVWGYVRAFAEAAMVGGLADWFAVTAIFRRPLGLPIPHTAVIPRNQPRIADAVGRFIADNFLKANLVAERVADKDLALGLGRWLAEPGQARAVAAGVVSAVPGLLDALDDATVADFLRKQATGGASGARLAPAFGSVIDALAEQGRHQAILDAALLEGFRFLENHQGMIRARVRERAGWLMRFVNVDRKVADALIRAVEELLEEASADPRHPVRQRLTDWVVELSRRLREDEVMQARVEQAARDAFGHPSVTQAISAGWTELKAALRRDCLAADSKVRDWLAEALANIGEGLTADPAVRDALNVRVRAMLVSLAERHGADVSHLVSETIRGWDARTIVQKLETNVGRDLQYIRLNGTIIGGLVGLLLHAGSAAL